MASLKPLTLHAHGTGPNPYKVAIVLELLSVPYEVKLWQFGDNAKNGVKGTDFVAINPNGRVPALEDPNTGVTSWESGACINYLLRVYDTSNKIGPPSTGGSEQARVDYDKWIYFLTSTLGPMMGQVNWFKHYHSSKNDDALERYVAQTYRCYDVLEEQLKTSGGGSILASGFSAVDAHFYPWMLQYEFAGLQLAKYPNTAKWLERVKNMPEVSKAYEKVRGGKEM